MTIRLFPHLPFAQDETAMSWATRMAAFHTGGRLVPFLNDLGIPLANLAGGVKGSIENLCGLGGEDPDRVGRNVVRRGARPPLRPARRGVLGRVPHRVADRLLPRLPGR